MIFPLPIAISSWLGSTSYSVCFSSIALAIDIASVNPTTASVIATGRRSKSWFLSKLGTPNSGRPFGMSPTILIPISCHWVKYKTKVPKLTTIKIAGIFLLIQRRLVSKENYAEPVQIICAQNYTI